MRLFVLRIENKQRSNAGYTYILVKLQTVTHIKCRSLRVRFAIHIFAAYSENIVREVIVVEEESRCGMGADFVAHAILRGESFSSP